MSCNIYEDPDLIMMDDKGRVEMLVDIYDGAGPSDVCRRDRGWWPQRNLPAQRRNPFTAAALVLLGLLVLAAITVLTLHFVKNLQGSEQAAENEALKEELERTRCKKGWESSNFSCYFVSNETKNWTESQKDCEKQEAHLVIINSKKENEFVYNLTRGQASWIGLEVIQGKKGPDWRWVDYSEVTNTFWNSTASVQPVLKVTALTHRGRWEPAYNGSHRWICEYSPFRDFH